MIACFLAHCSDKRTRLYNYYCTSRQIRKSEFVHNVILISSPSDSNIYQHLSSMRTRAPLSIAPSNHSLANSLRLGDAVNAHLHESESAILNLA